MSTPISHPPVHPNCPCVSKKAVGSSYLRLDLVPLCSDLTMPTLGLAPTEVFLVMTVKPLSLLTTPMA